jgi:hypothetical protein
MQPRTVRIADIERIRCTVEALPERRAEEVTTAQAVRMLASEIHAMQAKGYRLPAIAKVLSDNGLVIAAVTLKAYLTEARAPRGRKNRRNAKKRRSARSGAVVTDSTMETKPPVEANVSSGDEQLGARVVVAKTAAAMATPAAHGTPATAPKGTARPSDEASARRSASVPKEDTRDI